MASEVHFHAIMEGKQSCCVYRTIAQLYLRPGAIAVGTEMPRALEQYIEQRVFDTMDVNDLLHRAPLQSLQTLGFSVFFGGACHSVVQGQTAYYTKS
jgi:hypothetical protein